MMQIRKVAALALLACAPAALPATAQEPVVGADDVALFYRVYDAARGTPDGATLQRDYLDRGSPGLARFAELRRITGEAIAAAIAKNPALYEDARQCADALPKVLPRVGASAQQFAELVPGTRFPPVTIAIGRGRPVAVGEARGAYIGLEALCAWTVPDPDVENRMVRVIVHELVHTRQRGLAERTDNPTVLHAALVEGTAEFLTELLTGSIAYGHLQRATKGREGAIETAFRRDIDQPAMGSAWVFNGSVAAGETADLGYWVGYRIVKAHYEKAADKRQALIDILAIDDAQAFLAGSGWTPGMEMDE